VAGKPKSGKGPRALPRREITDFQTFSILLRLARYNLWVLPLLWEHSITHIECMKRIASELNIDPERRNTSLRRVVDERCNVGDDLLGDWFYFEPLCLTAWSVTGLETMIEAFVAIDLDGRVVG
jgi:hypothetical protein